MGAYAELIDNNGAFAEFVRTYTTMEEKDNEEEAGRYCSNCYLKFMTLKYYLSCCIAAKAYTGSIEDLLEAQVSEEKL